MTTATIVQALRDHNLRVTPQRVGVLEALLVLSHPDAEAVRLYVQERQATMSVATIYNALETLRRSGLVRVLEVRGRRCFDARLDAHDHMVCRSCGQVEDVSRHAETRIMSPFPCSWAVDTPQLTWQGLCPSCQQAQHG